MFSCKVHASACALLTLLLASTAARAEDDIPQPLDHATAVRIATERSQSHAAARSSARASRAMADAEGRLPDPEVMAEAWQVPIQRPLALGDSAMVSVQVRQAFPAPGVLGARSEAREAEAKVADTAAKERARAVERDAGHAFVDLQVAQAKHASHITHREVAAKLVQLAQARMAAGGGRLADVAMAEVERAKLDADVALEGAMVDRARARLNGMLRRDLDGSLVTTPLGEPESVALDVANVAAMAERSRPELVSVRARREADEAQARSARREAALPTFTVGAGWFAPTSLMPFHGYGVSVGATLPWVWGGAGARARAGDEAARASTEELGEQKNQIRTEAASMLADARASAKRLAVLRSRAKPAADAALEVAIAGYQSGQGDASALYRAEKDVVEIDVAIVEARSTLAHALVDLDWAVGTKVPRVPLDPHLADDVHSHGGAR